MKLLDETGFVFLDDNHHPFKCAMWDNLPWLFYWHEHEKHWVTLRRVNQMDIWTFPRNLTDEQQKYYHDRHNAWVDSVSMKIKPE